jgi:AraC-like DNA-binding protein
MEYIGRVPAPPLDSFIDDLYCLTGHTPYRWLKVPPLPSAHLFVNLAGPIRLYGADPAVPLAEFTDGWFMGVWTQRFLIEYPTPVRIVGVHFKPWGVSPFIDAPASELRDTCVPVDAIWQQSLDRIRNQVAEAASAAATLQVLEDELRSRLVAPSRGLGLVHDTAGRMESAHGAVTIGALSDRAGVSDNHLATQFKRHVGITPKRMARIYRFTRVVLSVDPLRPVDWTRLAHDAGYSDQAHLSKEFTEFTGHTPTAYVDLWRRFAAEIGDHPPGPMPAV